MGLVNDTLIIERFQQAPGSVLPLVAAAQQADGHQPLNEQGRLALAGERDAWHWVASRGGKLVGYAQLDPDSSSVQLVVHPDHRRLGVGRALADAVISAAAPGRLVWWAFGHSPAAMALARALGAVLDHELLLMGRDAATPPLPAPPVRPDAVITPFDRADLAELVAVNAAAFADHPEQGRMSVEDAGVLMSQPWFHDADLLIARDRSTGRILGFHWTKIIGDLGEVYVLGVHPDAEGRGLGRALLLAGLAHLRDAGASRIILYVDADSPGPIHLYESLGFGTMSRDASYHSVKE